MSGVAPPDPSQRVDIGAVLPAQIEDDRQSLASPTREALAGPLFKAWGVVRQLGFLNIGIFVTVLGSDRSRWLGALGTVVVLGIGVLRWARFRYWIEGDELVTLGGIVSRNRLTVPLDRIQSVSVRQNLLHRAFGLVEVQVHTAGSSEAEIQLSAVRAPVADQLRRLATVAAEARAIAAPDRNLDCHSADPHATIGTQTSMVDGVPAAPVPIVERSFREIVVVGLVRSPQLVILFPVFMLAVLGQIGPRIENLVDRAEDAAGRFSASTIAVLVLTATLFSVVAMAVIAVLRLHDLTLVQHGSSLRQSSGLLTRREIASSIERVQLMKRRRNPIERRIDQSLVLLPVAGAPGGQPATGSALAEINLPGTRSHEAQAIAELILGPQVGDDHHDDHRDDHRDERPISPLAVRRWTIWFGLVPAACAVGATLAIAAAAASLSDLHPVGGPVAVVGAGLAWILIIGLLAQRYQRRWHWQLGPERLHARYGLIGEAHDALAVRKVQNVALRQGLFQRRHGLATVHVRTAGRIGVTIPMLALSDAQLLRDELIYRAETDPRPFM